VTHGNQDDAKYSDLLHTPSSIKNSTVAYVEELSHGSEGLSIGINRVDDYLIPPRPGELVVVLARPGHGKSSLMAHYARRMSEKAAKEGPGVGYPIIVTAEMAIEDYQLRQLSTATGISTARMRRGLDIDTESWAAIKESAAKLSVETPTVFIGHSLDRSKTRPVLTIENVWRSIEYLHERHKVLPSVICIDYLQRMKLDKLGRDRRGDMSEVVEKCKDMAIAFSVPVLLGSQAGRGVEERMPPIPALHDGKETGNIEETPDCVLGLFRPISVFPEGKVIPKSTENGLVCTPQLFYLKILKQRGAEAGRGFWLSFDMATSSLADLELRPTRFNDYEGE
jgi:replicative DNA helicase